jgi:hypothetical protein
MTGAGGRGSPASSRDRKRPDTTSTTSIEQPGGMPESHPSSGPEHHVEVQVADGGLVLAVQGCLDDSTGKELVQTAAAAVGGQAVRVDIDLSACTGYTEEGAGSLVTCHELCGDLPDGLHYRTTPGPGQEALLAAYHGAEPVGDADLA